jgi:hypothetical protein
MSEMRELVLEIVRREGLIPSANVYQAQRADVTALGRSLSRVVAERIGQRAWANGLRATGRKSIASDAIRILGFGASLTQFLTEGVAMDTPQRAKVVELGAMANLIVSLYDEFVDRGFSPDILPKTALGLTMNARGRVLLRMTSWMRSAPSRLSVALVSDYFENLEHLAFARQRPDVWRALLRIIARMYLAERATVGAARSPGKKQLRRKCALPIVLMGLTAWLTADQADARPSWRHLRWLYGVGLLLGYVDDAVDALEDHQCGRRNLLSLRDPACVSREVTRLARCAARARNPGTPQVLPVVIASWFGGRSALSP